MCPFLVRFSHLCAVCLGLVLWLGSAGPGAALEIHVAPPDGDARGTGTPEDPYHSLHAALDRFRGEGVGQPARIILQEGQYGPLVIRNINPGHRVHIAPATGVRAHFDRIEVSNSSDLYFQNLDLWPLVPVEGHLDLVKTLNGSARLVFDGLDLRGREDAAESYMSWSALDWQQTWRANGFRLRGDDIAVVRSSMTGVAFAIQTLGKRANIRGNRIRGFSGDGIRILGHDSVYRANLIQDCFDVDRNHDDGIQSWVLTREGETEVRNAVIENNVIFDWIGPLDHPLRCRLQGIGLFDGFFRNFVIRNNLVVVDHYHGISIYGAIGGEISNNTVVHPFLEGGDLPWIKVNAHKNKTPSEGIEVFNNVAMAYHGVPRALQRNAKGARPAALFEDIRRRNYIPREGSPLIDAGRSDGAVGFDIRGAARPQGGGHDLGAFERLPED